MEPIKNRTKIKIIIGKSKVTVSANRREPQIIFLSDGTEVRANKLSTAFKFRATGYRSQELSNDDLRALDFKVVLIKT